MGTKAKRFWQNLPFAVSGAVLLALWAAGNNKKLVLLAGALGLAAGVALAAAPALLPWLKARLRPVVLAAGAVLAVGGGVLFTANWKFQNLALRLHISGTALVAVLAVLAAVLALPGALALAAALLEEAHDDKLNTACRTATQSRAVFVLLVVLAVGLLAVQGYFAFASRYIWADEVFSLKLIRHSVPELIALTAVDVHPPLYYLILKFFAAVLPFWPTVAVAKLVSLLPVVLLVAGAGVAGARTKRPPLRFACGLFAVCVAGLPSLTSYSLEIRMYSLGLLFVTACYVAAVRTATRGAKADWAAFVACGLAAAYTHYFACIAVALAYLVLLGQFLAKDRARCKAWLGAAAATVAAYLPWLLVLLGQLKTVKANYWIGPITGESLHNYWQFAFGAGGLWMVAVLALILLADAALRRKIPAGEAVWSACGILTPLWVVGVGVAASLLIRPVFMERYILPALGCLWLGVALAVALLPAERVKPLAAALLVVFALGNMRLFVERESYEADQAAGTYAVLDALPADAKIVSTTVRVEEKLAGMTERENYIWGDTLGTLPKSVYDNLYDFTDEAAAAEALAAWAEAGDTVCFIEHQDAVGAAQKAAAAAGLRAEPFGSCGLGEPLTAWLLVK